MTVNESIQFHIKENGKFYVQFVAGTNSKVRFQRLIGTDRNGNPKILWTRELADKERQR